MFDLWREPFKCFCSIINVKSTDQSNKELLYLTENILYLASGRDTKIKRQKNEKQQQQQKKRKEKENLLISL